jgi:hypothetical protein
MEPKGTHVSVRTREGLTAFRRAGLSFTRDATIVDLGTLSPEQRTQLLAETELVIEDVAAPTATPTTRQKSGEATVELAKGTARLDRPEHTDEIKRKSR